MKICFINAPCPEIDDANLEPPLGALYIASNLRINGYTNLEIFTMTDCKTEEQIQQKINEIPKANIYSFTTYCTNYNWIKQCIQHIRKNYSHGVIILGGPNASALPKFTLEDSLCDYVVVGEGEDAFLHILKSLENNDYISNIVYGTPREDINTLSHPAWDLINLNTYTRILDGERVISILSSRGCPNNCTHCNSIVMGAGKKIRYRNINNIIEEIKYLQSLGYSHFRFNDDNLACRPDLIELTLELKKLNIKYRIFAHIKDLTDTNCKYLADSGCIHIAVGLESLNPDNLKFLRKNTNVDIVDMNLRNVKRYGMTLRCFFIIGLPSDNDSTIEKYFWIASLLPFDEYSIYPLIPYCGTEIWNNPKKHGYTIINKDFTQYYQIGKNKKTCYVLDHINFTHNDVKRWIEFVYNLFEKNKKIHSGKSETK